MPHPGAENILKALLEGYKYTKIAGKRPTPTASKFVSRDPQIKKKTASGARFLKLFFL